MASMVCRGSLEATTLVDITAVVKVDGMVEAARLGFALMVSITVLVLVGDKALSGTKPVGKILVDAFTS